MIYRPMYVDKIMAYVDTPFVKVLTGVRRCGKSTIFKMIMEKLQTEWNIPADRIVSCRYDSMEYEDMTAKQMYAHLKERLSPDGKTYLFTVEGLPNSQNCLLRVRLIEDGRIEETGVFMLQAMLTEEINRNE